MQSTRARMLFTCSGQSSGKLLSLLDTHLRDTHASLQQVLPNLETVVDFSGEAVPAAPGLDVVVPFAGLRRRATPIPGAPVTGEDIAVILFTSGSTGRPKGVLRRHDQSLRNRFFCSLERGCSHRDRLLVVSEFSHSMGLSSNLLCSLMFGATLVIAHNRNAPDVARLIREQGITSINAPPSLFAGLLRERVGDQPACASLRLALTAATDIPPALVRELIDTGVDVVVSAYGMTECEVISTTARSDSAELIATTVGKHIVGLDVRIFDEGGCTMPTGAAGEIWVRGAAVCAHYLGANGEREPVVDAEGWLHTGDVGCFTAAGYLRVLGRRKDVMTIHGYTLYPAEIEALLSQSGMLKEVVVMGSPHELAGDLCVAFIVPADAKAFSIKQLRLWARDHMADYKIPARFVLLERLPFNRAGKVDRISLGHSLVAQRNGRPADAG